MVRTYMQGRFPGCMAGLPGASQRSEEWDLMDGNDEGDGDE